MAGSASTAPRPGWVDSHCHLGHGADPGPAGQDMAPAEALVRRAGAAGVTTLVDVGIDAATTVAAAARAGILGSAVHFTAGLHPCSAERLEADWDRIVDYAGRADCAAIGETGFDFYWHPEGRAVQQRAFERHLELARKLDRAVIVHSRDAFDATFEVLAEHPDVQAVIHCFSGGPREAERALELGCWLSFAGPLTWKKTTDLHDAARRTPLERALIETDSPFLTPTPHRGKPNEPAFVALVGERLADLHGVETARVAQVTGDNARRLFRLDAGTA